MPIIKRSVLELQALSRKPAPSASSRCGDDDLAAERPASSTGLTFGLCGPGQIMEAVPALFFLKSVK